MDNKHIVLAIDDVETGLVQAMRRHAKRTSMPLRGIALVNRHYPNTRERNRDLSGAFEEIYCDFEDPADIEAALAPYRGNLLTVTCRQESSIDSLRKVVPHLPEIDTPSAESLLYATEKRLMRDRMSEHDDSLTPRYRYLTRYDKAEIDHICDELNFPVIVKPNGLAASILVTKCDNKDELNQCLKDTFAIIGDVYARDFGRGEPSLLVEEMIRGDMYSTDAYVDPGGTVYCLPLVKVITAHALGFEGFYSYRHIIPTAVEPAEIDKAFEATGIAIEALGLRATTTHVELFQSPDGWKIIEIGPRIGGYREDLYREAYGVDHYYNDLAIRLGLPPEIPTQPIKYAAGINIYAEEEGIILSIEGIGEARKIAGALYVNPHADPGDHALFASNGGRLIVDAIMSHTDPDQLEANVAHLRKLVKITVAAQG